MGTSMLQRSQTTSSHIKVINKNSSSAELQSLFKLHHESAKKREEARGYSTAIGVFEGPGGGNFSEAAPQRDRGGAQILQHFRCAALFEPSQWVSGDPVGGRTSASPRGAWPCSARSARSSNAADLPAVLLAPASGTWCLYPWVCWNMFSNIPHGSADLGRAACRKPEASDMLQHRGGANTNLRQFRGSEDRCRSTSTGALHRQYGDPV